MTASTFALDAPAVRPCRFSSTLGAGFFFRKAPKRKAVASSLVVSVPAGPPKASKKETTISIL